MKTLRERSKRTKVEMPLTIPTADGKGVAETVMVEVEALKDPVTGDVFLEGEALEQLDKAKARHMGLLLPSEIKGLRLSLGLTQKEISELMKIGEKTYSLWESGRGRPSQSLNQMLKLLWNGRVTVEDLRASQKAMFDWSGVSVPTCGLECRPVLIQVKEATEIYDERFAFAA